MDIDEVKEQEINKTGDESDSIMGDSDDKPSTPPYGLVMHLADYTDADDGQKVADLSRPQRSTTPRYSRLRHIVCPDGRGEATPFRTWSGVTSASTSCHTPDIEDIEDIGGQAQGGHQATKTWFQSSVLRE